nr:unnamed protein product [Digitaria exilis]CAB3490048.1 unnamed protein product [Digitaria exilis]
MAMKDGTGNGVAMAAAASAAAWNFAPNEALLGLTAHSVRGALGRVKAGMVADDGGGGGGARPVIPMGQGDPSLFPCFRTAPEAVDAVAGALRSGEHNCYSSCVGLEPARRSIAQHLSNDLPYELSPDDVYLTNGCAQAIEIICSVLARPGANILVPRPGYLFYEARAVFNGMEARYFDLLPEKDWEVDIDGVQAIADKNTVAMVIVNPGNPCGNVYSYEHLAKASSNRLVAETARNLGIFVITDEVYAHLTFGERKFVPMADTGRGCHSFKNMGRGVDMRMADKIAKLFVVDSIKSYLDISSDPPTFVQGAIPNLLKNTKDEFFNKTIKILRETADICWEKLKGINAITCPSKPEGSMFVMVKLDLTCLPDIKDDMDFCCRLAKEELVRHLILIRYDVTKQSSSISGNIYKLFIDSFPCFIL